jgi:Na+-transporting NADH:ubiquinone oxidoreductase subunit C
MHLKDSTHTLVFATTLALVCSSLLTATSLFTASRREANETAEQLRNYLSALEVPIDANADSAALLEIYEKNVRLETLGALTVYKYIPEGSESGAPVSIAIPFNGPGLWAHIEGVLATEPDMQTIRGIRFYKHEETPGLGGEISADWFQDQFKKKSLVSRLGVAGFRILKPGSGQEHDLNTVDGITGATMTSDLVQNILDDLAQTLAKELTNNGQ